jgi:hypothetical protein
LLLCGPRKIFDNNYLELGRPFSTYGGQGRCIQGFGWGSLRESYHLEDPGVEGVIILRWIFSRMTDVGGMDWIELA